MKFPHPNYIKRGRIYRPIFAQLPLGSKPRCLVCQQPMKRNNPTQIVRYHPQCRELRTCLTQNERNKTP